MRNSNMIYVWDPLVRVFHWLLVMFFFAAYFSGEEESLLHVFSGYAVIGLLVIRIVWGLIGSKYARFSEFVVSPLKVLRYLIGITRKEQDVYVGHNPAGGYMILLILIMLALVSFSGLKVYGLEGFGPLKETNELAVISSAVANSETEEHEDDDLETEHSERNENEVFPRQDRSVEAAEEYWEEIHEAASNIMLLLIAVHVIGVFVSSRLHNENLVKAMINGWKQRK